MSFKSIKLFEGYFAILTKCIGVTILNGLSKLPVPPAKSVVFSTKVISFGFFISSGNESVKPHTSKSKS